MNFLLKSTQAKVVNFWTYIQRHRGNHVTMPDWTYLGLHLGTLFLRSEFTSLAINIQKVIHYLPHETEDNDLSWSVSLLEYKFVAMEKYFWLLGSTHRLLFMFSNGLTVTISNLSCLKLQQEDKLFVQNRWLELLVNEMQLTTGFCWCRPSHTWCRYHPKVSWHLFFKLHFCFKANRTKIQDAI
jgi:hypothetical protein